MVLKWTSEDLGFPETKLTSPWMGQETQGKGGGA